MTLGLVCDACDALSPINATVCQLCGASLGVVKAKPADAAAKPASPAELFGGAQSAAGPKVCGFCGADIAPGHRFCGNCGKPAISGPAGAQPAAAPGGKPGVKPGKTMF